MPPENHITALYDLIAQDELNQAIEDLRILLKNNPKQEEVIILSARLNDIQKQIRLAQISYTEADLMKNKIRLSLLDLLNNLRKEEKKTIAKDNIEQKIAEHKNIVQNAEKIYNINHIDNANF